jgi:hypothetical protein
MLACATGLARRIEAVYLDQRPSVPLGFIFELADKLTPSHITDSLGKAVVLDHVLDRQTLDAHHLVFVNNACAELLLVVASSVLNARMNTGYFQTSFVSVFRSLLFLRMSSLGFCQLLLILGKEFGITHSLAGGEDDHRFESKIETDLLVDDRQGLDILFYQERDEVAVGTILADCCRAGLRACGKWSMPVEIQRLLHFGKSEPLDLPRKGVSSVSSRLSMLLFLACGILGTSLKKVREGSLQVSQGLLKRYRGNSRKPRVLLLEVRQHGGKFVIGELLTTLLVGCRAGMQTAIVDKADTAERLGKNDSLLIGRIEPEFVCPLRLVAHGLLAFLIFFDVLFQSGQNLSTQRAIMPVCNFFHLFQDVNRKANRERFGCFVIVFHASILHQLWMHIKWLEPLCPQPQKRSAASIPVPEGRGFTRRFDKIKVMQTGVRFNPFY